MFGFIKTNNLFVCELGFVDISYPAYNHTHRNFKSLRENKFIVCRRKFLYESIKSDPYYSDVLSGNDYFYWKDSHDNGLAIGNVEPLICNQKYISSKEIKRIIEKLNSNLP